MDAVPDGTGQGGASAPSGGLLLTLRPSDVSLDEGLRRLVRLLQTPMADR